MTIGPPSPSAACAGFCCSFTCVQIAVLRGNGRSERAKKLECGWARDQRTSDPAPGPPTHTARGRGNEAGRRRAAPLAGRANGKFSDEREENKRTCGKWARLRPLFRDKMCGRTRPLRRPRCDGRLFRSIGVLAPLDCRWWCRHVPSRRLVRCHAHPSTTTTMMMMKYIRISEFVACMHALQRVRRL